MKLQDQALSRQVEDAKNVKMKVWHESIFESLGLRNPFLPNNLTIQREAIDATRNYSGAVVECGVYRGKNLATLTWLMRENRDNRSIFGFDSFAGFPVSAKQDEIKGSDQSYLQPQYFGDTNVDQVKDFFSALGIDQHVNFIPGHFEDTLPTALTGDVSVLLLDCDLYGSYHSCLRNLYHRVQPGGWIVFDEYYSPKYPGARIAVDEFFADKPEKPILAKHLLAEDPWERWFTIKT